MEVQGASRRRMESDGGGMSGRDPKKRRRDDRTDLTLQDKSRYPMSAAKPGRVIIFNIETFQPCCGGTMRQGSKVDADALKGTLEQLKFKVTICENSTVSEMINHLATAAKKDYSNYDSFMCVVLSHGSNGQIYGSDGPVSLDYLMNLFHGTKGHRSLLAKPKIFVIQACRGSKRMPGTSTDDQDNVNTNGDQLPSGEWTFMSDEMDARIHVPAAADFLVAYSTVPDYVSWRHQEKGTRFIQALCQRLKASNGDFSMLALLIQVNNDVVYGSQEALEEEKRKNKESDKEQKKRLLDKLEKTKDTAGINEVISEETRRILAQKVSLQVPQVVHSLTKDLHFTPKGGQ